MRVVDEDSLDRSFRIGMGYAFQRERDHRAGMLRPECRM